MLDVSVPSRGLSLINFDQASALLNAVLEVSVPSRGLSLINGIPMSEYEISIDRFPSPLGD